MADSANQGGARPTGRKLAQAANAGRVSKPRKAKSPKPRNTKRPAGRPEQADGAASGRRRRLNYPRAGKGPIRRWLPSWRFLLGSFLLLIVMAVAGFAVAYAMIKVPEPSEFAQAQTTTVYYADGSTVMGEFAEVDREIIDATQLPDYVGNAVVASEDRSFYSNNGIDPKGIIRAFVNNMRGGALQGASTLTQQYIKNYYVDTTSSYAGKFKQAIMAIKIDREMSKQDILGSYLNTVYFGRGAYGIEAASQAFFGHPASELTVSESALLAGILPSPSAWDPALDPDQAAARWQRVLDYMLEDGYITQEEYDSAEMPETVATQTKETYGGPTGYLLQLVRAELESDAGLEAEDIDTGGYKIVTTIDKKDQDAAVAAVQNLPEGASPNLRAALVSIDSSTGGILALYGGEDYLTNQVNSSTDAVAQAGSTFKPFALVAALENGDTLANGYNGDSPMTIDGATFQNYQNVSYGWSNLIKATTYSINTSYLQLNRDVGPEVTNKVAVRAGYPEDTLGLDAYVQNVLGSASPHTLDIATAYATFSAQGTKHKTHIVNTVTNSAGSVAYTASTDGEKVFSDDVMADATYAMQQVVNSGSGTTALALGRPVAAKTGSSSDNKSAQFVGYTPQIATAVTLYQTGEDGSEESITPWGYYGEITGSTYPADIFTEYMTTALADLPIEYFPDRTAASYYPGGLYGTPAPVAPAEDNTGAVEEATEEPTVEATEEATPAPVEPTQEANDDNSTGGTDQNDNSGGNSGSFGGNNSGNGNDGSGGGSDDSGGGPNDPGGGSEGGGDSGGGQGGLGGQ
ncbi:Membrane carboxypeptidase (penicillin-binding protein) [Actinomyces ruminicola]|uniref:Membrane carboxypeptidase (Penicillin-binding protein) n=1 Tax=Actinomyces ruminicola TaxID=332524 RepID=A0A1H0ARW8_9ACTO|nr:transglycosylase domain-containing protein [Actinomyces ruminicola]SDN36121.1 Membrane carboxypeptidase (penicillin-binding protein) [Actinomyces ruminicola]